MFVFGFSYYNELVFLIEVTEKSNIVNNAFKEYWVDSYGMLINRMRSIV